jgi:hypothetical protein
LKCNEFIQNYFIIRERLLKSKNNSVGGF